MKTIYLSTIIVNMFLLPPTFVYCQSSIIKNQKSIGGSNGDYAYAIIQSSDKSVLVAGDSYSIDGNVTDHHGTTAFADAWIAKRDLANNLYFSKSLGGLASDGFFDIQLTSDHGYIAAGYSYSNDGDVKNHHGTTAYSDFWVVKLDSMCNVIWEKSFGGSDDEKAESIKQTSDGGYIAVGYAKSQDGDVTGNHGGADFWVIKLTSYGELAWQRSFGGSSSDWAKDVVQSESGEYFVAGYSDSNDGDVSDHHGSAGIGDFWILKLESNGNKLWTKSFGGTDTEQAQSIQMISNTEFVIAGEGSSKNGDVTGNHGSGDFWIINISNNGNLNWQKSYGGRQKDRAYSIKKTLDKGFIVAGDSYSKDGQVSGHHGSIAYNDFWIVKLDSVGNLEHEYSFGGTTGDNAYSIIQLSFVGEYVATGWCSSNDGDVIGHHGNNSVSDYWIIRLKNILPTSPTNLFTLLSLK